MAIKPLLRKEAMVCSNIFNVLNERRNAYTAFKVDDLYPEREYKMPDGSTKVGHFVLPRQRLLHESTAKFTLFHGGVGTGKSLSMCVEMVRLMIKYPGIIIYVVTAYDYYFDEFILPTWREVMDFDHPLIDKYNARQRKLYFKNGSTCTFKAFDNPEKIKGFQCHIVWVEEASEIGEGNNDKAMSIWKALLMRLRAPNKIRNGKVIVTYPLKVYASENPKGHNYIWRVFVKDSVEGERGSILRLPRMDWETSDTQVKTWHTYSGGDEYFTIHTSTRDNPFLSPTYVNTMESFFSTSPELVKRMLEGEFNPVHSLVYTDPVYSVKTHVIPLHALLQYWQTPAIPSWWHRIIGIDPAGIKSPWAVEFYVETPDGEIICYDEIYRIGITYAEICEEIREKINGLESVQFFMDPIMGKQHGHNAKTLGDEFSRYGIQVSFPERYGKQNGIFRVYDLMHRNRQMPCKYLDDWWDDEAKLYDIGQAKLYYIENACIANLKEKEVYRIDSRRPREMKEFEEGLTQWQSEKVLDRDDHAQTAEMFALLGYYPLPDDFKAYSVLGKPVTKYGGKRTMKR